MKPKATGVKELRCHRCQWRWIPRKPTVAVCPKCHSTRWWESETKREHQLLRHQQRRRAEADATQLYDVTRLLIRSYDEGHHGEVKKILDVLRRLCERITTGVDPGWQA